MIISCTGCGPNSTHYPENAAGVPAADRHDSWVRPNLVGDPVRRGHRSRRCITLWRGLRADIDPDDVSLLVQQVAGSQRRRRWDLQIGRPLFRLPDGGVSTPSIR